MARKKKSSAKSGSILNRRATFDYNLGEELTVGLVLNGPETRAARDGHIQLKGSFVSVRNHELWLNNASFSVKINEKGSNAKSVDTTARKLLASKKQIASLEASKQTGMTIVPVKLLTKGRYIKMIIALGKGKKNYDKRESLKKKQEAREVGRMLKERG